MSLDRPARIFVSVEGEADSGTAGTSAASVCALFADGVEFSTERSIAADFSPSSDFTLTAVTPVLQPGTRALEMDCQGPGGGAAPRIFKPAMTTLVIGGDG